MSKQELRDAAIQGMSAGKGTMTSKATVGRCVWRCPCAMDNVAGDSEYQTVDSKWESKLFERDGFQGDST